MIKIGNFLFRYRNGLFPLLYALLFVPSRHVLGDFRIAAVIGFTIAAVGQFLRAMTIGLEYIVRGGRNRQVYAAELVTGGMFAHCRNPLYLGNFLIIIGLGVASSSVLFVAFGIPLFAFIYRAIIAAEENYLHNKFGREFERYCEQVNRFAPNLRNFRQTVSTMQFNWRRLITAEYSSTYFWLVGLLAVVLRNTWSDGHYHLNSPGVLSFFTLFVLATIGYLTVLILKKTGRLSAPRTAKAGTKG